MLSSTACRTWGWTTSSSHRSCKALPSGPRRSCTCASAEQLSELAAVEGLDEDRHEPREQIVGNALGVDEPLEGQSVADELEDQRLLLDVGPRLGVAALVLLDHPSDIAAPGPVPNQDLGVDIRVPYGIRQELDPH